MSSVSVVVTCFNLGHTLKDALDSVSRQTRRVSEILVVDDGSDDPLTLRGLATIDELNVRVIRTTNRGVAEARNLGVRWSAGDYVVLLDGDDMLDPKFVERLAGVLDARSDLDFVTSGVRAFGAAEYDWIPAGCTWEHMLASGGPHISTMWRRALWECAGGFDPDFEGYEDLDFWLSAVERGCQGYILPEYLLRYRVRPDSRYRRAIAAGRFESTMAALYRKHPPQDGASARRLLVAREWFLEEQRQHAAALEARRAALAVELRKAADRVASAAEGADPGAVDWGDLRRTSPVSAYWGLDRGGPLDRYYIEQFLQRHAADVRGAVLEVKDPTYTAAFGGRHVTRADVVDVNPRNPRATIVADLGAETSLPDGRYDCFILTQTLHIVYNSERVIKNAYRLLKPGGVMLLTVPCVSRLSYEDGGPTSDYWRFTAASIRRLVASAFPPESIEVETPGNVWTCAAFLHGLSPQDLPRSVLDVNDPAFPLICCVRAVKPPDPALRGAPILDLRSGVRDERRGALLLYHRVGSRSPDTHQLAVDVIEFESHLRHLRDEHEPLALHELLTRAEQGRLPDGAVAVTFDDGYLEHLTVVSPLLLKYDIPATFFVNTDRLDEPHEAWWDELERLLLGDHPAPAYIDLYGDGRWRRSTADEAGRRATHQELVALLYPMSARARATTMDRLKSWAGHSDLRPRDSHRVMVAGEIAELASRRGHTIGAHSVHHLALPDHPVAVQASEILDCRSALESLLRRPIDAFAYPYGAHAPCLRDLLQQSGFDAALTTSPGSVGFATDPLLIPRLEARPGLTGDPFTWVRTLPAAARHAGGAAAPGGTRLLTARGPLHLEVPDLMRGDVEKVLLGEYEAGFSGTGLTVLDVGANVGSFALWANLRWPNSTIHAYEPHPGTFALLERNVRGLANVHLHNVAVYPTDADHAAFYSRYDGDGEASLLDYATRTFAVVHRSGVVQVRTVHPRALPSADIVKVDTEGSESAILCHMNLSETSLVLLEYQDDFNRTRVIDCLRENFTLEREERYPWDALLTGTDYRQDLAGDHYGLLFFANRHLRRIRKDRVGA